MNPPSAVPAIKEEHLAGLPSDPFSIVLDGADVGLALFNGALELVSCNEKYRDFFHYTDAETPPGVSLEALIRIKLKRHNRTEKFIDNQVSIALTRLKSGGAHRFSYTTSFGDTLSVVRNRLPNGNMVETVTPDAAGDANREHGATELAELARRRMTHALDGMADGFCLYDADDRLVLYNRKYVEYNPHIADIIVPGAGFEEMLRTGVERAGFIIGDTSAEDFVQLRLRQHRSPEGAYDLQLADGRWIRAHEKRTEDGGIVGIRSDITELKNRELDILRITHELRKTNIQFDTALNNMIQGLCMFDDEQTLLVRNSRYLEMYGFDGEIVKPGIKLREIMEYSVSIGNYTDEDAKKAIDARPDHAKLRERATLKQRLRDGRVIAVMHQPMPNGGSIATYQDITELERHAERLQDYTQKLEISNRELQDFAHVASHDLQEPLRKIEAFGGRLAADCADALPDDGKMYIERMQNAAGRMRQLIEDLLDFSRITTKAKPFAATDLNDVLSGVLSDLQIGIEESGAKVIVGDLPTIDADSTQMRQLLQNLIGNAIKFIKPDAAPEVRVNADIRKNESGVSYCHLEVADNGIGFDEEYTEKIFTIFQRVHGKSKYAGTGIGLATCRKIAERHGGEISAKSTPGEGAVFSVRLPVSHGVGKVGA